MALMIAQRFYIIFTVKYNVRFELFKSGLGLDLLKLTLVWASTSRFWLRPRLGLKWLASASASII